MFFILSEPLGRVTPLLRCRLKLLHFFVRDCVPMAGVLAALAPTNGFQVLFRVRYGGTRPSGLNAASEMEVYSIYIYIIYPPNGGI